jgi:hypothetical protein
LSIRLFDSVTGTAGLFSNSRLFGRRTVRLFALIVASIGLPRFVSAQSAAQIFVGASDIASCDFDKAQATALLLDKIDGTVFTAGDHAYSKGSARQFSQCYGPSWGRHRERTRPAPGNHDYESKQAEPYFKYFGANAGPAGRGYYSYNLGSWHLVSLNSNTEAATWGKPQEEWLAKDLAASSTACKLAYWHQPYVSSGKTHGNTPHMRNLFATLYRYGVDVAVSGHDHIYERFAPQNPDAKADARGIRQFIAGTGGASLYEIGAIKPNSEVRNNAIHGVLKFTLHDSSYDWEFVPIAGQSFRDRGSANCHVGAAQAK